MFHMFNPSLIDALLTVFVCIGLVTATGACLWLLPWTDQSIRNTDKMLNPVDLTRENIRLQRLVVPGT
tara:strand:- start:2034 stop:2237 length:204 start_codon:yes stop_codon:yes gene_type:complete